MIRFFCLQRIEVNEAVEFIYGKEKNPCLSPAKMKWYDWLVGRDGRSECRDFLAYVFASFIFVRFRNVIKFLNLLLYKQKTERT